ncbi:MAG: hypothetical protein ACOCY7_02650 [Halodesulfurarchaeum sp.]
MTSHTTIRDLTIEPIERIPSEATVHHVDQLSERAKAQFFSLVGYGSADDRPSRDLIESDVIVFTDTLSVSVSS